MGIPQSRWTLSALLIHCDWLNLTTVGGLSSLMKRLKISYKRGRDYIRSPDPFYDEKRALIQQCYLHAQSEPTLYAFHYQDEFSYYRQPTVGYGYEAGGPHQPLAHRSHHSNTRFRIAATLDALTGQILYLQRSHINRFQLVELFAQVCAAYPTIKTHYIVVDNWPVHFHPDVLAALQPQQHLLWPIHQLDNWPSEPTRKPTYTDLPIQLLTLPTYASWLNPIEKLWRWLKQDILHLHRYCDRWDDLKQRIADWLDGFRQPSDPLLRYVGLLPD